MSPPATETYAFLSLLTLLHSLQFPVWKSYPHFPLLPESLGSVPGEGALGGRQEIQRWPGWGGALPTIHR